ncbi:MAG: C4-type zinc ribbon domain-containing protein [Candidatus Omnitrophica bacterium]|nr:C4-type zinc ribbon domain-containing protein [Candidatus Omnitrophota bacterium]
MNLKDEMHKLVQLQKIDLQIYRLIQERDVEKPAQIEKMEAGFQEKKKVLETLDKELKDLQVKRKNKELDLAAKEEAVKKSQAQLYQLKTNKEYQAKLTEIASIKADVSLFEEDVLKVFDSIEKADAKFKAEKERLICEEKKFKEEEAQVNLRMQAIGDEISNLDGKRNILAKGIDQTILTKYEKLLKTRFGVAMAAVDNDSCGACHMHVTAQKINEIKMYKELVFCESCVRLLYVSEDIPE